jgi:hypothetical protein
VSHSERADQLHDEIPSEAAERLGRSPQSVRLMAASGDLDAVKRGNGWWLDARSVERRRREQPGRGRPLSPAMAWSVLLLASGAPELAGRVAGEAHQPSRGRRWLRDHPLREHFARLRARAVRESFDGHPAEIGRILGRGDVMATGVSVADLIGLHGGANSVEFYAPASARAALIDEHALDEGHGPVLARWVPDELWPVVAAPRAPRAAALLDLLENDDPRARREAARAFQAMTRIELPADPPGPWNAVAELVELLPADWVLIGGLMVQLHAWERGVTDVRATVDADVLAPDGIKPPATLDGSLKAVGAPGGSQALARAER